MVFKFNNIQSLKVCIADGDKKENLYYVPTSEINKFDIAHIFYDCKDERLDMFEDILEEVILLLENLFRRALKRKLILNNNFKVGQVGKKFNEFLIDNNDNAAYELLSLYALDSSKKHKLVMYEYENNFYIEIFDGIAKLYDDINAKARENFTKMIYKPIALIPLKLSTITIWHEQCQNLLKKLAIDG